MKHPNLKYGHRGFKPGGWLYTLIREADDPEWGDLSIGERDRLAVEEKPVVEWLRAMRVRRMSKALAPRAASPKPCDDKSRPYGLVPGWKTIPCPTCAAPAGESCSTRVLGGFASQRVTVGAHVARRRAAASPKPGGEAKGGGAC